MKNYFVKVCFMVVVLGPGLALGHENDTSSQTEVIPEECPTAVDVDLSRTDNESSNVNRGEKVTITPHIDVTIAGQLLSLPESWAETVSYQWACDDCDVQLNDADGSIILKRNEGNSITNLSTADELAFTRYSKQLMMNNSSLTRFVPAQAFTMDCEEKLPVIIKLEVVVECEATTSTGYSFHELYFSPCRNAEPQADQEEAPLAEETQPDDQTQEPQTHDESDGHTHDDATSTDVATGDAAQDDHTHTPEEIVASEAFETECDDGLDSDADGFADCSDADCFSVCRDIDADGVSQAQGDCNDYSMLVNPLQTESCDGIDNDCDGEVDEDSECSADSGASLSTAASSQSTLVSGCSLAQTKSKSLGHEVWIMGVIALVVFAMRARYSTCEMN